VINKAPVAQLDRVLASEAKGRRFESCRARHSGAGQKFGKSHKALERVKKNLQRMSPITGRFCVTRSTLSAANRSKWAASSIGRAADS
ncbi:uncharacterized protein METZ01_LOCUS14070, partial [marine metagenome]